MRYHFRFIRFALMSSATLALSPLYSAHADEPVNAGSAANTLQAQQNNQSADLLRDSRVATGFRISPVPLNVRGKNPALVGLGSYLVNAVGGCNDCHTHPSFAEGGDPFVGQPEVINAAEYLAGGRTFGPIVSANITPNEFGLPAGLRFEQKR